MDAMAARPDDAILNLPVDERLALVDSIWESIRENADAVLSRRRDQGRDAAAARTPPRRPGRR
jgi:hypothetical protein